ncbi:endonuclease/exonuclease/phosphatase family metal-dependent hydrolase [Desulfosalsimonas propionicica]|uniref:Endonuclease/exonuclease/phosphatase family metal-dependent hydrolase n=1 Tax=Desulfosalsimonas propionicica TaxID=332175 RepID=A0A7W0HMA9_9BACT|nr:endonuclease/exonuclease/phosphatase family protein [Desulfosalsimonas propionicica]MBA2882876.1 endonuclease/exonuclease/phosphatase family metal-dependent hydrolase [Desulfosalsimonas propionicica]
MSFAKSYKFGKSCILAALLICLTLPAASRAGCIKIAAYNLENLFDLKHDGTEYTGYIPGGPLGWNRDMMETKVDHLARVIHDLDADIIGLQEVESPAALETLLRHLAQKDSPYPYSAIADARDAAVRCALLSRFAIMDSSEIFAEGGSGRSILRADIDISGNRLIVFVNHWKSKSGPESRRMAGARALAEAVEKLPEKTDYVLLGDFNTNYNEHETLRRRPKLNDTGGKTGLEHVLNTRFQGAAVDERQLIINPAQGLHYNLWLELDEHRRWSARFFGRPQSPDAILLPAALYDDHGISYLDNSFDRFDPGYLFDRHRIRRWQRADQGRGRHLGRGYSDHLPVYACLQTGPFVFRPETTSPVKSLEKAEIADLYNAKAGAVRFALKNCAVIYRHGDNAVIKQPGGRAVYVYKAAADLDKGAYYDLVVIRLKRFHGNLEVTGVKKVCPRPGIAPVGSLYISDPDADFSEAKLENEVIGAYTGRYANGHFYYGNQRKIRLYFADKALAPQAPAQVRIRGARIGYHRSPELVIEKNTQIREVKP